MNLFGVLNISGSALTAERIRAEVTASNMANADTTRTKEGGPYHRQHVVFQAGIGASGQGILASTFGQHLLQQHEQAVPGGVEISAVVEDQGLPLRRYDPQHPDADKDGYVSFPDINPLTEMVDLMGATRAYGLNSSAIQATKTMINASLEILK